MAERNTEFAFPDYTPDAPPEVRLHLAVLARALRDLLENIEFKDRRTAWVWFKGKQSKWSKKHGITFEQCIEVINLGKKELDTINRWVDEAETSSPKRNDRKATSQQRMVMRLR